MCKIQVFIFCSFNNTLWLLQIVHTGILILLPSFGHFSLFYFLSVGVLCVSPTSANSCHTWSRQWQRSAAGRRSAIWHLKPGRRNAFANAGWHVWEEIESITLMSPPKWDFVFPLDRVHCLPILAMSSLMDILYHPSPMKESKNTEIVGIWGWGPHLTPTLCLFCRAVLKVFNRFLLFFLILYLQILLCTLWFIWVKTMTGR